MNLYLACGDYLHFPAPVRDIQESIAGLDTDRLRIIDAKSPIRNLAKYIQCADLSSEEDLRVLNAIAQRTDAMTETEAKIFSGVLDSESVNGLNDVLRIAHSLEQYQIIPEVTSDRELGIWLVDNNLLDVSFPETVRPYLDYVAMGAEYYANHGGAYTLSGYVKRKEDVPQPGMDNACIRLTLAAGHSTFPVCLPDWGGKLELAKRVLNLDDLDDAVVRKIEFKPSMSELEGLLPLDSVTADTANDLACVLEQIERCGELEKFYCALSANCPDTFAEALDIATDIDDYELVPDDAEEYGRQVLRRIGADDEIIDAIDGYMNFSALGEVSMSEDGVRRTEFGLVRRLSEPFPQQDTGMKFM